MPIRRRSAEWFSSFQGPIAYAVAILRIALADDVAFCHSLNGESDTRTDGAKIDKWWESAVRVRQVGNTGFSDEF